MVEDSGLFIDSLNNFPGVFSSFVYDSIGLSGILKLVNEDIIRGAEYRAVTIIYSNGEIQKSTGICRGRLSREELGDNGFGYDPIFIPEQGNGNTFSQMSNIDKSTISHRTYSLIGLLDSFKDPSK
jgi:XTP/dITP diphosphohydrolase